MPDCIIELSQSNEISLTSQYYDHQPTPVHNIQCGGVRIKCRRRRTKKFFCICHYSTRRYDHSFYYFIIFTMQCFLVPGLVQNLMATLFNTTAVNVSWTEPSVLNGQFQRYDVTYSPNGKTLNTMTPSILIGNLMDEKYTFEVRVVTGGGTSEPIEVEQRPVCKTILLFYSFNGNADSAFLVPPTVSGPEKTIPLEFNSKRAISCDFRSYPFRGVAKLMRSNEDLTSSANVSNRTEAPPHSQRLTYTVSRVGSYSCAFAGSGISAGFYVTGAFFIQCFYKYKLILQILQLRQSLLNIRTQ